LIEARVSPPNAGEQEQEDNVGAYKLTTIYRIFTEENRHSREGGNPARRLMGCVHDPQRFGENKAKHGTIQKA
jgi:hypothetical protein